MATKTEKRIEMVKLLVRLREGDEPPGETILRALKALSSSAGKKR
jgi:hypothetical protein